MTTTEDLLLGPAAADLLAAVLEPAGLRMQRWERHAVHARPGAETSVGYAVVTEPADASTGNTPGRSDEQDAADASTESTPGRRDAQSASAHQPVTHHLTATTAAVDGPGVAHLRVGDGAVAVWAHPDDPALPALRTASTPDLLAEALRSAGDPVSRVTSLATVTYRPLRRAVLAAGTDAGDRWVKVLRADRSAGLVARLDAVRAVAVPVPETVAHLPGLVALGPAAGRPLADHLHAGDAPHPRAVLGLLERLADAPVDGLVPRRPWAARLDRYAAALVDTLTPTDPGLAQVVMATASRAQHVLDTTDPGPVTVTHGDLHPANLRWDPRGGLGVIDVDTLGPGHLVDDLACLLAHVAVLPTLDPGYRQVPGWRAAAILAADRVVDPAALRARTAAVLLSLAAGRPAEHLVRAWVLLARDHLISPVRGVPVPRRGTPERRAS